MKQRLEAGIVEVVGLVLEPGDLLGDGVEAVGVACRMRRSSGTASDGQLGGLHDDVAHLAHLGLEGAHLEQRDRLGGLVHLVDGVVHRGDQVLDVAAVERA